MPWVRTQEWVRLWILESLPGPIVDAIHQGMGEAMHLVFVSGVPFVVAALVLALFVKQLTLRTTH